MTEEKKEKEECYRLVQVPTEHALAVKTPDEEIISTEQLLVKIANDVEQIKKGVL